MFIKLNETKLEKQGEYYLDATQEYEISSDAEFDKVPFVFRSVMSTGFKAIDDYHRWLIDNGFNPYVPNPTNEFVSKFYGKKPLWKTELSQGIVVKDPDYDDYYIVLECSRNNPGYKYLQVLVTPGGCL